MNIAGKISDAIGWVGERTIRLWLRVSGKKIRREDAPWLASPAGPNGRIGEELYDYIARSEELEVRRSSGDTGLIADFDALAGPGFDPARVDSQVRHFYEHSSLYRLEAWSETSILTRVFLWLIVTFVSRRMDQLNFPLSAMETARGMSSELIQLVRPATGEVVYTGWLRKLGGSGRVIYAGLYSVGTPSGEGPCVKVSFPLPLGNSTVFLRPEADEDGSLRLASVGKRFGDAGFYRVLDEGGETVKVRYLGSLRERFRVYVDEGGDLRTDHTVHFVGLRFLYLHYKITAAAE